MIEDLLKKLGFSEKEILVYLTILENGKISPASISSITKIKRPTVYSVGKELLKRGVITEDVEGHGGYFVALPPENLETAIKKQEKEIAEQKKVIKEAVEELSNIPKSKSYSVPKMRFIDEYNIKDFLYKQTPVWEKSMSVAKDTIWWGFQDHTMVEDAEYRKWVEWYWNRAPKEYKSKLITNDSDIENKMKEKKIENRTVKFWKKDSKFTATNWILGDYVILFMTKQRPHYIVEIHDAVYAENMRELFRNLWEIVDVKP